MLYLSSAHFVPKEVQLLFRQLKMLSTKNIAALKCESRKNNFWVPWYIPYAILTLKSVKVNFPRNSKIALEF